MTPCVMKMQTDFASSNPGAVGNLLFASPLCVNKAQPLKPNAHDLNVSEYANDNRKDISMIFVVAKTDVAAAAANTADEQ